MQLGDIVRAHGPALRATCTLTPAQHAVLRDLERCRTPALGGHRYVCEHCGHELPVYNSCRNRHCPTCQSLDQHRWLERRAERILPIPYFHVVFTLPEALRSLVQYNRAVLFDLLFKAASQALLVLSRDPKRLGALPAITLVLHTWTRDLIFHPHIHAVVSAGGLSPDCTTWVPVKAAKGNFLFPKKVLAKLFRRLFRQGLLAALASGAVRFPPQGPPGMSLPLRKALWHTDWVAHVKKPFGGAEGVMQYLGRYTHRVGISNARLRSLDEHGVTFATKHGRTATLDGVEFLRRFLQHVLPKGFVRIRHYGLLAACHATSTLELARTLLAPAAQQAPGPRRNPAGDLVTPQTWVELLLALTGFDALRCPRCGIGRLVVFPLEDPPVVPAPDTS